jgi:hypothetical protein
MSTERHRTCMTSGFDALIMVGPPTTQPVLSGKLPIAEVGRHHEACEDLMY